MYRHVNIPSMIIDNIILLARARSFVPLFAVNESFAKYSYNLMAVSFDSIL